MLRMRGNMGTSDFLIDLTTEEKHQKTAGFFLMDMVGVLLYLEKMGINPEDFCRFEVDGFPERKSNSVRDFLAHAMNAYHILGTPRENFHISDVTETNARGTILNCVVKQILDSGAKGTGSASKLLETAASRIGEARIAFSSDPFCRYMCAYYMGEEAKRTDMEFKVEKGLEKCTMEVRRSVR